MNEELTEEERRMMARILSTDKWDNLTYDLTILVPSFIIVGFGLHFDSAAAIITGLAVYAVFALRTSLYQAKTVPVLKSLMEKLNRNK